MEITLNIPTHISPEDAQAVIAAFMAAQAASQQNDASPEHTGDTHVDDEHEHDAGSDVAVACEPEEQDDGVAHEQERSYSSVPSDAGAIPLVVMTVGAQEGGLYGDISSIRLLEEADRMKDSLREYAEAALAAAADPDRKRPPRAEPELVDAAVKYVVRETHNNARTWIMDDSENGFAPEWAVTLEDRQRRSDDEQEHICFVISETPRRTPGVLHNHRRGSTAWGFIELISRRFGAVFTKAQVRASVKRLIAEDFIREGGMCGKSAYYMLTDRSAYKFFNN